MPSLLKSTPFAVIMGGSLITCSVKVSLQQRHIITKSPTKLAHEIQHLKASSFATTEAWSRRSKTWLCVSAAVHGTVLWRCVFHRSCILHWSGCCDAYRCCRRDVLHNCIMCGIHRWRWLSDAHSWRGTHVLHQWTWCGINCRNCRNVLHNGSWLGITSGWCRERCTPPRELARHTPQELERRISTLERERCIFPMIHGWSWRDVLHDRSRRSIHCWRAGDHFGRSQEVNSRCPPPLSSVLDCTVLGVFGRGQEVSDCCLPFLSPTCVIDRRAFVGVRERCLPLEPGRTSLWRPSLSLL